ncbi:C-type lectin domain family 12 member A-like isoform X2 [Elephas maximus indicus]|uniref:C-type lectin domain family 12 member A-like isoform X2 n=1 Tax=Elephas maximus indicus TaxID=99487 RepID=UPI0021165763|nr:C-type lectin domain family 12 member A-like isoform X2 [Elephas maximus indicus]
MSEEVTYADLNFQHSSKTETIQESDHLEKKAPSAPSRVWRRTTWALSLLCLLLLIGLGILGSIFYRTSKIEMRKLNKLQNLKEELERNISLQHRSIMNISITLQKIATELCRELYKTQKEHKCKPCPEKWLWHEDTCYSLPDEAETWQNSERRCSAWNASLLKIKSESVLVRTHGSLPVRKEIPFPSKDRKQWDVWRERYINPDMILPILVEISTDLPLGIIAKINHIIF